MANSNIIDMVKSHCKLYTGGTASDNPYKPDNVSAEKWALEYLKFQIWDAEYAVVKHFDWWYDTFKHNQGMPIDDKAERAEAVYKLAISDKLRKMRREDIDFQAMYFAL